MLLIIILSMVIGGLCTIVLQIVLFYSYMRNQPVIGPSKKPQYERARMQKQDLGSYQDIVAKKEPLVCLNVVLAFIFRELKDTDRVRRWVVKKMNVEFDELLQSKTVGRVMEAITVRDYSLGPTLPIFKNATLLKAKPSDMTQVPDELDIGLDVIYNGGFRLAVDADLVFGKAVYVCVVLKYLKGHGRLQLTRHPYTHWSFAFLEEPEMDFEVESQFEGRMVSQLGSLIINQIRRSIRKKHTLPNYKIRYKPFFVKPDPPHASDDIYVNDVKISVGKLQVNIVECTRLPALSADSDIYCSLYVDSLPWKDRGGVSRKVGIPYDTVEVEIQRVNPSQAIGAMFKQDTSLDDDLEELVVLETITPQSPASRTDLKKGDILISVDGGKVTSVKNAARLIKQAGERLTMKVKRPLLSMQVEDLSESSQGPSEEGLMMKTEDDFARRLVSKEDDEYVNITLMKSASGASIDALSTASTSSISLDGEESLTAAMKRKATSSPMMLRRKLHSAYEVGVRALSGKGEDVKDGKTVSDIGKSSRTESQKPPADGGNIGSKEGGKSVLETGKEVVRKLSNAGKDNAEKIASLQVKENIENKTRRGSTHSMKDDILESNDSVDSDCVDGAVPMPGKIDDSIESDIKRTSTVPALLVPCWDELFNFEIYDSDKYLNICVWNKGFIPSKPEQETLIGYVSIPLMNICIQCLTTASGEYMQTFQLQPPERQAGSSRRAGLHPEIAVHRGFEECLCYGDVTVLFNHTPDPSVNVTNAKEDFEIKKRSDETDGKVKKTINHTASPVKSSQVKSADGTREKETSGSHQGTSTEIRGRHDLIGTQFYSPTRCDLCVKKVWTKYAFQCRACAMICHKKCVDKAQTQTYCSKDGARWRSSSLLLSETNKTTKDDSAAKGINIPALPKQSSPKTSPKLLRGLPRMSHLPLGSTFLPDTGSDESSDSDSLAGNARTLKSQLLQTYGSKGGKSGDSDALVVSAAKEMGKELFSNLDIGERKEKLNAMISKLQMEIDQESESRTDLYREEKQSTDLLEKKRISARMEKSDERLQALALLMLHYCAGLHDCTEQEERLIKKEKRSRASLECTADDDVFKTAPRTVTPSINPGAVKKLTFRSKSKEDSFNMKDAKNEVEADKNKVPSMEVVAVEEDVEGSQEMEQNVTEETIEENTAVKDRVETEYVVDNDATWNDVVVSEGQEASREQEVIEGQEVSEQSGMVEDEEEEEEEEEEEDDEETKMLNLEIAVEEALLHQEQEMVDDNEEREYIDTRLDDVDSDKRLDAVDSD